MNKFLLTALFLSLMVGLLYKPVPLVKDEELIKQYRPSLKYENLEKKSKIPQDSLKLAAGETSALFPSRISGAFQP